MHEILSVGGSPITQIAKQVFNIRYENEI